MKTRMFCALAAMGVASVASADVVQVDAKAAIFDAGRDVPTLDGQLPPMLEIPQGAYSMQFAEVTGLVRAHRSLQWAGPDGNDTTLNDTDINSYEGISGIVHPRTLPLVAVFLGDDAPEGSAPARLDFYSIGSEFSSLSPVVGQSFFVGDGWNSAELAQEFMIPQGATRVFFGLADASYFTGEPGAYSDNDGWFSADVRFNLVPAPGSLALLGLGGLAVARRRR